METHRPSGELSDSRASVPTALSPNEPKRVRTDTGPLLTRLQADDRELGPATTRVWPWYGGGVAMLAAATVLALTDLGGAAPHAAANVLSATARCEPAPVIEGRALSSHAVVVARAPSPALAPEPITPAPAAALAVPAPAAPDDGELAKSLNALGFAARKDGDHAAARMLYREALEADADHVWSRYNLACEHALLGEADQALALLQRIADIGGVEADKALFEHAPRDKDFAKLRRDRRFMALTRH